MGQARQRQPEVCPPYSPMLVVQVELDAAAEMDLEEEELEEEGAEDEASGACRLPVVLHAWLAGRKEC